MSIKRADLLPPAINGLVHGRLDEELHLQAGYVPVTIHNPDFIAGDYVEFFWRGVDVNQNPDNFLYQTQLQPGLPEYDANTQTLYINVPIAHVTAAGRGGRVLCSWQLTSAGSITVAPRQAFTVGLPLPTVQVSYSSNLRIGMSEFTGDLPVLGWPWAAMRVGDRATLTVLPEDGSAGLSLPQQIGSSAQLGQPVKWRVQRSRLLIWQLQRKAIVMQLNVRAVDGTAFAYARQRFQLEAISGARAGAARLPAGAGAALDPGAYPDGLEVLLPEGLPTEAGDVLSLVWRASGEEPVVFQQVADWSTLHTGYVRFVVPYATLLAYDRRDIVIDWQLDGVNSNLAGQPLLLAVRSRWVLTAPIVVGMTGEGQGGQPGDIMGSISAEAVRFTGLRVRVPAFNIGPDDVIEVHMEGDSAGGRYSTSVPEAGTRDYIIPPPYVAPNMGGEIKRFPIYYTVTSPGASRVQSPMLQLRVATLPQTYMPMPQCPQAQGGVTLSLSELSSRFDGEADIQVSAWPYYQPGQRLRLLATGIRGGQAVEHVLFDGPVSNSEIVEALPVSFLETLTLSTGVDIRASVAFDMRNFMLTRIAHLNLKP